MSDIRTSGWIIVQVDDPWLREVFCILARSHTDKKQASEYLHVRSSACWRTYPGLISFSLGSIIGDAQTLVFFWRDSRIGIDGFSFAFIAFVFISAYLAQFFIKPTNLDKEESVQYPCAEYSTRLQVIVITHV